METETGQTTPTVSEKKTNRSLPAAIVIAAAMISGTWLWTSGGNGLRGAAADMSALEAKVLPASGYALPVRWGDLGVRMIASGVIDRKKLDALYARRDGLNDDERALLDGADNGKLVVTSRNAGFVLNLLWALGLANRNPILEQGPMMDKQYGGADKFASTGGWTLSRGKAMDHYSRHDFFTLTPEQQAMVARVAGGIYRPCCNNPTHFPDCNHGMAMLGLLELMASQGATEDEMYRSALAVNAYWFPDNYLTIAQYLASKGMSWEKVDPRAILSAEYSSASGFQKIAAQVQPAEKSGGGGCGV